MSFPPGNLSGLRGADVAILAGFAAADLAADNILI